MSDPFTWFVVISAVASAGAATVDAINIRENEKERRTQLEFEKKNVKLQALDEENQRLQDLSFANSAIIANSGNIDPFASMSLIAAREFNFRQVEGDLETIQLNLATARAQIATKIAISKRTSRAATITGILGVTSALAKGGAQATQLNTPKIPKTKIVKGKGVFGAGTSTSGGGGIGSG